MGTYFAVCMKTLHRISIVGCVLKPEVLEGVFQNKKTLNLSILKYEHNLETKVFMIIEAKTWDRLQ